MLFGVCLRYAADFAEAEDLLQESFVKIYRDLYQYRPTGALGAWMRKVAVNVCLMHLRKRKQFFADVEIEQIAETYETKEDNFDNYYRKHHIYHLA